MIIGINEHIVEHFNYAYHEHYLGLNIGLAHQEEENYLILIANVSLNDDILV